MNITYIVSTYKKIGMLRDAIERLAKIKSEFDEVIVVDGNSGNAIIDILKEFKKKRL